MSRKPQTKVETSGAGSFQQTSPYSQGSVFQHGRFIGRELELAKIEHYLTNPGCRLLTLCGLGGIGKSYLAWEAGLRLAPQYKSGAYFAALAPLEAPYLLVPAIAAAIGYYFTGSEPAKDQLLRVLSQQEMLLILDNFEHLLSGVDFISELLQAAPDLHLIVTSRERLRLREEWVLDLNGLEYPRENVPVDLEMHSAIRLFIASARRVNANFELTEASQADIIRICSLVEGLPLGIELAAGWTRVLPCRAVFDEIARNLDFLTTNLHNIPDKHRSIRAVFAYSYGLLMPAQQQVFMRLSIFRGGFSLEAAKIAAGAALDTLTTLVDKSLLRVGEGGRYNIHELLRQYAEDQIQSIEIREHLKAAHCHYYAEFVRQRVVDLKGQRQIAAMEEITADFENVRQAWSWAVEASNVDLLDRMLEGLWVFGEVRERWSEVKELFSFTEARFSGERVALRPRIWRRLVIRSPKNENSRSLIESVLQIARQNQDDGEVAFCLFGLSNYAYEEHDYVRAIQLLEQSLALCRELGDDFVTAIILDKLAASSYLGTWEDFRRYHEESLRLRRALGDNVGIAWGLAMEATAAAREGNFAEAEDLWMQRVTLGRAIENRTLIALGFAHLSYQVYFIQGNLEKCRIACDEAIKYAIPYAQNATAYALSSLGLLEAMDEHYHDARQLCEESIAVPGLAWAADLAAWGLCITACGTNDFSSAKTLLPAASKVLVKFCGVPGMLAVIALSAILDAHHGDAVTAVQHLALAITHPISASSWLQHWPLLDRVRSGLEQQIGTEAYWAEWERGTALQMDGVMRQIEDQFQSPRAQTVYTTEQLFVEPLTERELQVLRLLAAGLSNQAIAEQLIISIGTVKAHTSNIYGKLGVENRIQAVTQARKRSLV